MTFEVAAWLLFPLAVTTLIFCLSGWVLSAALNSNRWAGGGIGAGIGVAVYIFLVLRRLGS